MMTFDEIYRMAVDQHGSKKNVESLLPEIKSKRQLVARKDDRYLSDMCRRVFRAGLKHSLVDSKWPAFEKAFDKFGPIACSMMSDEAIEQHMKNTDLIRHFGKLKTIRHNALMVRDVTEEHGSFGKFIANWPEDDIVGLWLLLKKRGSHLGGNSGAAFLRMVGKDTFRITDDVVQVLKREKIVAKIPTSKKDLYAVQGAFNQWQQESGRSYAEVSRIVSLSVGPWR